MICKLLDLLSRVCLSFVDRISGMIWIHLLGDVGFHVEVLRMQNGGSNGIQVDFLLVEDPMNGHVFELCVMGIHSAIFPCRLVRHGKVQGRFLGRDRLPGSPLAMELALSVCRS